MIKNYRLDKSFGPVGAVAGVTIFFTGLILTYFSLVGPIFILFGAFVGFTSTSTLIDYDRKRLKYSNNLFGFIQIGQWINLESNMTIEIKKSNKAWRTYSRGSRSVDIVNKDYRLILIDSNNKQIMPLMKTPSLDSAKAEFESLANLLGLRKE